MVIGLNYLLSKGLEYVLVWISSVAMYGRF
jgi:hypothetical protein